MFWRNPKKPSFNKLTYFHGRRFTRIPRTFGVTMSGDQVDTRSTAALLPEEMPNAVDSPTSTIAPDSFPDTFPSTPPPSPVDLNESQNTNTSSSEESTRKPTIADDSSDTSAQRRHLEHSITKSGVQHSETGTSGSLPACSQNPRTLNGETVPPECQTTVPAGYRPTTHQSAGNERQPLISFDEILGAYRLGGDNTGSVTFMSPPTGATGAQPSVQFNTRDRNGTLNLNMFGEAGDPWTRDDPTFPRIPDEVAPPPYDAVFQGWRLSFKDFHPRCLSQGGIISRPTYERFDAVVAKANSWLRTHPGVRVRTSETLQVHPTSQDEITVLETHSALVSEYGKSRHIHVRALRLWLVPAEAHERGYQRIGYVNVVPACLDPGSVMRKPVFDPLGVTVDKFNQMLQQRPLPGRILTTETIDVKFCQWRSGVDPERGHWEDHGDISTSFVNIIRVFYEVGHSAFEEIGFADFMPECLKEPSRVFSDMRFEDFLSVSRRAEKWISQQDSIRVTNIKTMPIKLKGSGRARGFADPQQTLYNYWGTAHTRYLRVLRVSYVSTRNPPCTNQLFSLSYKVFVPTLHKEGGLLTSPKYEMLDKTMQRAMMWLKHHPLLSVVCAETVPARMYSHTSSTEPMLTSCPRGDHGDGWMYILRIYLSGDVEDLQSLHATTMVDPSREEQRPCCCLC